MPNWVTLVSLRDLPPRESLAVVHGKESIALFNVNGEVFATSNCCPHAAGPLVQGFIEKGRVVCPWHGWSFPLSPDDPPNDGLRRYRVRVEEGAIQVLIDE
jgi:nitrite reductase/ring-hydroxylating ferredoxin subunit